VQFHLRQDDGGFPIQGRTDMHHPFLLPALVCLLLPAIHSDLSTRTIPNWLSFSGIAAGLVFAAWLQGGGALLLALLALAVALSLGLLFWLAGWFGAGDVKLLAAVATLTGPALLPDVLVLTAACGLLLALASMVWQGRTRHTLLRLRELVGIDRGVYTPVASAPAPRLPYALAIAAGTLIAVLRAGTGLPS
jgi:prepilin peptidase CpaA